MNPIPSAALVWSDQLILYFDAWKTTGPLSFFGTLLFLFSFALLYELVAHLDFEKILQSKRSDQSSGDYLLETQRDSRSFFQHLCLYMVFTIKLVWDYSIMLAIMSTSGGVFITIILGRTVGHFISRKVPNSNPHLNSLPSEETDIIESLTVN